MIGNHLTQHQELPLLAIGLAGHIQSLPTGARVDITSLAAGFPEGATRISAALRELETHGYLRRDHERTASGRIVTRTTSCNQPRTARQHTPAPEPPASGGCTAAPAAPSPPRRQPRPLPAVPHPASSAPLLLHLATDLLAGLRHHDPRLLLTSRDTTHPAAGAVAWLERDVTPEAVRHALTHDLPRTDLRRPAALLAHRLTALLPSAPAYEAPSPPLHPLHTCEDCDRAFRAPGPGRCRDCRPGPTAHLAGTRRPLPLGTAEVRRP
ncbi:helix-turn-helix domain-containing protein [Streptomyces alfalfae]|uniref:helix-turn-helix domain-containing protein n=1 Tax=Streptomyces alfalfae TaxID=1642299 RepID=UPI001BABBE8C|nr:helix-turn-helix domain-containing protein [Streptomyces alfalfae]